MNQQKELYSVKKPIKEIITEKLHENLDLAGKKINSVQSKIGTVSSKIIFIFVLTGYLFYFLKPFFL
ncbi:hypothetical protein Emtol_0327 (plasmid) [Emticicia oligotrophica DSM 17448]|uniref:Tetrahydromethanopterin S-methyltransferase n=1 Tax=Emticicia oligotrophica (strain DSM 17448 / CIP 109782 / MTCC 6937 / GPTSA100-15) TaxID=929562 RepID=A0ABM5N827_EMTOG|nr:hypothetical protein [Emticicia oligotrophica]AFK05594.1 hypothetical protein Emtol_0327 [Emticicia oligotrophica DSM 17448]